MPRLLTLSLLVALGLAGCDASGPSASADALSVRYLVDGQGEVSYLGDNGLAQARSDGQWETRFQAAPGAVLSVEAVSSDGSPVTARIEVDGVLVRSSRGTRARADSRLDDRVQGEVEIHAFIDAVDGDRVTVGGQVFVVHGGTRLLGRNNETVPLSTFTVGTFVEAEGHVQSDGTIRAKKLKLDDDGDDDGGHDEHETEVEGIIDAIDATSITVSGVRFETDSATRWLDDDNNPISPDAFQVGDHAEAEGWTRGGVLYAEKVKLDDEGDGGDDHETEVEGTIDAIDAISITVSGVRFETDGATRWLDDDGDAISRDAFQVGLRAEAEGWMRAGVLYAEKVKLDDD